MKRLLSLILSAAVVSLAILSCKDDFNEEDFLRLQSQLKLKQDSIARARNAAALDAANQEEVSSYTAALNAAGELMSVTILVRENSVPVSGVAVSISSGTAASVTGGKTEAAYTATSDANGNALFDKVTIGRNLVKLSKSGYIPASAIIDFGSPTAPTQRTTTVTINGVASTQTTWIPPAKRFESIGLPFYSNSTSTASTATITGKVTIETDVTNKVEEIPQGISVTADLSNLATAAVTPAGGAVSVTGYKFEDGTFGTAVINNTTGEYSLVVPATAVAYTVNLIFPTIETNQKIAVAFQDGTAIATGPEYRQVLTAFGNNAGAYDAIPTIYGARVVVGTPPAAGRGFGATFAAVARSLPAGTVTADGISGDPTVWNFSNRGRGFTSSPSVAITGGGGTGATATTSLRGFHTVVNIATGGSGLTASTPFDIRLVYTDANVVVQEIGRVDINSTGTGDLPTGNVTLPNAPGFAGQATPFTTTAGMTGFAVQLVNDGTNVLATVTTAPTINVTRDTELNGVTITNGGSGFTTAATFAFSGGGTPTVAPAFSIASFKTQFDLTLNSTNTTPYKVRPAGFAFAFPTNAQAGATTESPAMVTPVAGAITQPIGSVTLLSQLMTDGTNITSVNPQFTQRTTTFWQGAPTLVQIDQTMTPAVAFAQVSVASGGTVSVENPTSGVFATDNVGAGYDAFTLTIQPSATGAPGTGAVISPTVTVSPTSKIVTWSGASTVVSGGSGYLDELNQIGSSVAVTAAPAPSVQAGRVYKVDFKYGTGRKKVNVLGNFR